jgi:hypothetical protein
MRTQKRMPLRSLFIETKKFLVRLPRLFPELPLNPQMKLSNRFLLLTLAAAIALPVTASAAKADRKKKNESPETTFATIDKDGDGVVTEQEYVGLMGKTLGETAAKTRFADLDKDKNGKLSKEEYATSGTETKRKRGKKNKNQE